MFVLPLFVMKGLSTNLKRRLFVATNILYVVASVDTVEPAIQKQHLRFFLGIVHFLHNKFANDWKFTKMNSAILHNTQPVSMTPVQGTNDLYVSSCREVGDFLRRVGNKWHLYRGSVLFFPPQSAQVLGHVSPCECTDIALQGQSLLANQNCFAKISPSGKEPNL